MAKVDLGSVSPVRMYLTWTDVVSTLTPATVTTKVLAENMVDNSVAIFAMWSPNATGLSLPSDIGNYIMLTVVRKASNQVSFTLNDLVNNTEYKCSKYGEAYTTWTKV